VSVQRDIFGAHHSDTIDVGRNEGDGWVRVSFSGELGEAVEGWRAANGLATRSEAVTELVRLGLLSEIAKVYGMVTGMRDEADDD
jgi:hypothetical protein